MYLNLKDTIQMVDVVRSRIRRAAMQIDLKDLPAHIISNADLTTHVFTTEWRMVSEGGILFDYLKPVRDQITFVNSHYKISFANGHQLMLVVTTESIDRLKGIDPQFVVII